MNKYIPLIDTIKNYNKNQIKGDLSAGLTVGVMLIPQGMAYAMIAGLPPIYGLYASTLPLIIYALLGTSRQLAVGPVAMVSLLTASAVGLMAEGGTEAYIEMAIILALLVGLIQFFLGIFKLGFLVNFLSHPVISGFTSAAALIIGMSQLKHLLGVDIARSHYIHEIIIAAANQIGNINWTSFLIGLGGIGLIIGIKKVNKSIPGSLLAVLFGILVVWGFGLIDQNVKIVGSIPHGLPDFGLPTLDFATLKLLIPAALAISLVSFMESIAVAKAIQAKHKDYKIVPDQELIALGLANVGGAFIQSYPVTGGFSRTAVNDQSGAKTSIASIISALLIVLTLLFLTPLFYFLPNAILASIIMVAVFGLIDIKEANHLWSVNRSDFWMLFVTFIATLVLGIEQGIGIGVILSLSMIIYKTTRPHIAVLGKVPDTIFYRNIERFDQLEIRPDLLIVRFDAQLYFANINFLKDNLEELIVEKGTSIKAIIINAESINNIDSSAIVNLNDIVTSLRNAGIDIFFSGVKGPVRDAMDLGKLIDNIGEDNFHMCVQDAVNAFDNKPQRAHLEFTSQSNV
ncbi:MAG: solute carrier family 26 protein [Saprospiraceae bacterium]